MKVTIIGPNLRDQSRGTFHVHANGCSDIRRERNYVDADKWTFDAESRRDVAITVYDPENFMYDPDNPVEAAQYVEDFHFAPCVGDLP